MTRVPITLLKPIMKMRRWHCYMLNYLLNLLVKGPKQVATSEVFATSDAGSIGPRSQPVGSTPRGLGYTLNAPESPDGQRPRGSASTERGIGLMLFNDTSRDQGTLSVPGLTFYMERKLPKHMSANAEMSGYVI